MDIRLIEKNLEKAKSDLAYWEKAREVFLDPRRKQAESVAGDSPTIAHSEPDVLINPQTDRLKGEAEGSHNTTRPQQKIYGELKRRVLETLPEFGSEPFTVQKIVQAMQESGYAFMSQTPAYSVNAVLSNLNGQAYVAGRNGPAKLWTKGRTKSRDQQLPLP